MKPLPLAIATGTFALMLSLQAAPAWAGKFRLSSPSLSPNSTLPIEQVFSGFGCSGGNVSPALSWSNAPAGTQSYAVTLFDPDAPTDSGWWHWVVINLPSGTNGLEKAAGDTSGHGLPAGAVQVRTDFGKPGFGGACPPPGNKPHRYIFTVYALKTAKLDLPENASAALASFMIRANAIGKASLTTRYGR